MGNSLSRAYASAELVRTLFSDASANKKLYNQSIVKVRAVQLITSRYSYGVAKETNKKENIESNANHRINEMQLLESMTQKENAGVWTKL